MTDLVPLSVLSLELGVERDGWTHYLAGAGVAVVEDDLGRLSVSREDARTLITGRREAEAEAARKAKVAERQAVEADERRRAQILGWHPVRSDS